MSARPVTPMSLLIDVFVLMERMKQNLEMFRDKLVEQPDAWHSEILDALGCCRRINDELRSIKSLQDGISSKLTRHLFEDVPELELPEPEPPKDPNPPKGSPDLKLVS